MCYSVLECLLETCSRSRQLSVVTWASPAGENRPKTLESLSLLGVRHTQRAPQCAHPSGAMVLSSSSQHSPLADQPACRAQQGQNPTLKKGSQMTHEMQPTPRTTVVLRKLRVGRMEIFLFEKGNKDSGCRGRAHLHSTPVRVPPGRRPPRGPRLCCPAGPGAPHGARSSSRTPRRFALNRTNANGYRFLHGINIRPFSTFLKLGTIVRSDIRRPVLQAT